MVRCIQDDLTQLPSSHTIYNEKQLNHFQDENEAEHMAGGFFFAYFCIKSFSTWTCDWCTPSCWSSRPHRSHGWKAPPVFSWIDRQKWFDREEKYSQINQIQPHLYFSMIILSILRNWGKIEEWFFSPQLAASGGCDLTQDAVEFHFSWLNVVECGISLFMGSSPTNSHVIFLY